MFLGRVVGRVWATVKNEGLTGHRLLIVQPVTPELKPTGGRRIVCADWTGAGAGELVYWCRGRESSFPFLPDEVPTDNTIVAIIDELHVKRPESEPPGADPPPAAEGKRPGRRAREKR